MDKEFQLADGGTIRFASDMSKAWVKLNETADFSTLALGLSHFIRRFILNPANAQALAAAHRKGITDQERKTLAEWAGAKNVLWDDAAEDKFVRAIEKYLRDGKAPDAGLQPLFDSASKILTQSDKADEGSSINIEITPEVKAIFDKLLVGGQDAKPDDSKPNVATPEPAPAKKPARKLPPTPLQIEPRRAISEELHKTSDQNMPEPKQSTLHSNQSPMSKLTLFTSISLISIGYYIRDVADEKPRSGHVYHETALDAFWNNASNGGWDKFFVAVGLFLMLFGFVNFIQYIRFNLPKESCRNIPYDSPTKLLRLIDPLVALDSEIVFKMVIWFLREKKDRSLEEATVLAHEQIMLVLPEVSIKEMRNLYQSFRARQHLAGKALLS